MIRIAATKNPFAPLTTECQLLPQPVTVAKALELVDMPTHLPFVCVVNGVYVLRSDDWDTYMIPDGGVCRFLSHAQGAGGGQKKNPLATVLTLVVLAAVTYGAGAALAPGGLLGVAATGPTAFQAGLVSLGSALLLAGASYLINMALPPTFPKPPEAPDPAYSILSRSNQARIGAPQEVGYGRTKFYPSICAAPYSEFSDSFLDGTFKDNAVGDQTLFEIYMIGWGHYDLEEFQLTDQSIDTFPEVVIQKFEPGELITSFPSSVITVPAVSEIPLSFPLSDSTLSGVATATTLFDGSDIQDAIQRIRLRAWSGGQATFSLFGEESAGVAFNGSALDVQNALSDLSVVGHGNVLCQGGPLNTADVTCQFIGALEKLPLPTLVLDATGLVDAEASFPNWNDVIVPLATTIHASNVLSSSYDENLGVGWVTFSAIPGGGNWQTDELIGSTMLFAVDLVDLLGHDIERDPLSVSVTISSNTGKTVFWKLQDAPTTLRYVTTGDPVFSKTGPGAGVEIIRLNNWEGPYKINPDEASDEINSIAVDLTIPDGRYMAAGSPQGDARDEIALSWRIEYQPLDDDGDPTTEEWTPLVTDPRYFYYFRSRLPRNSGAYYATYGNVHLEGKSNSPTRFTVRADVPLGRYQVRVANTCAVGSDLARGAVGTGPPSRHAPLGPSGSFADLEDGTGVAGRSLWTALRGYGTRQANRWEDRTILTMRITASDAVNSNTLKQFGVTGTRMLQDYVGPVDSGTLPTDPLTTTVFTDIRLVASTDSDLIPKDQRISTVVGTGLGDEFKKGDYVRLSGFSDADNNGEFLVTKSTDNKLKVMGSLVDAATAPGHIAGSRKVRSRAPTIVDNVGVTSANVISATGLGAMDEFQIGSKITLQGFPTADNNIKCDIVGVTANTVTVTQTLTVEAAAPGQEAHSVPPEGLTGQVMEGLRAALTSATAVGGISAADINTQEFDNVAVVVTVDGQDKITTLEATGIGLESWAVVGNLVSLGGYDEKANQGSAVITAVDDDALTVALKPSDPLGPIPTRSTFVDEAADSGKKVYFGLREVFPSGDTSFYFFADVGATSAATGGGTISYEFPNEWTDLRPSRRISSAAYDLATDENFGGGVAAARIDTESLWSREVTWNARDRYEGDGITWKEDPVKDRYDARLSERKLIHEHFQDMARCGRARPMYPSGRLTLIRDEPRPVGDDAYDSHNIIKGSLSHTATFPTPDSADYVLAQFFNEEFWDFDEVTCTTKPYSLSQSLEVRRATGGSFKLTLYGEETTAIDDEATATNVENKLHALSVVAAGSFVCTGGPLGTAPVVITYAGPLLGVDVPKLVMSDNDLRGNLPEAVISFNVNPDYPGVAPARLVMPGIVQRQQAWREGMYELGSSKYRRMLTTFETDIQGYIPSYLSRIQLNDEAGSWGQHGLLVDYVDNGDGTSSLFTSEPLEWGAGTYVMQLRNHLGQPVVEGLIEVTQGDAQNEAVMSGTVDEDLNLHTEHQFGREATTFSFGPVDNHTLNLLVTGIRPTDNGRVSIEAYTYREENIYDIDDDLQYLTPSEEDILDARGLATTVENLQAVLMRIASVNGEEFKVAASWSPALWARHYQIQVSSDAQRWTTITTTPETRIEFVPPIGAAEAQEVEEGFTCGSIIDPIVTIIARKASTEPTPWVDGAYDGMFLRFSSGVHAGRSFLINQTLSAFITLSTKVDPKPDAGTDTFDIVEIVQPSIYVAVRGYNGVYGGRATQLLTNDTGVQAAYTAPPPQGGGGYPYTLPPAESGGEVTHEFLETERTDYCGNLFLTGRVFDSDHPTRHLYIGYEVLNHGTDAAKAYLPSEPRYNGSDPALLLFLQDSLLTYVASSPGEAEYTLVGTEIQLGFDRTDEETLHAIMVSDRDKSGTLDGIRVGEPCAFTGPTTTATLPFTAAREDEVLLYLNGDVLFPVAAAPGSGEFSLSGTTITTGDTLVSGDVLLCLGLADDGTTEAYRFRCAYFNATLLPNLPLYPEQLAIAEGGTMRWNATGFGNFRIRADINPPITISWGDPVPVVGDTKYAILLDAKAP